MKGSPALLAAIIAMAASALHAETLAEHAATHPLVIQTVAKGERVDLGKDNQVNNLKEGGRVLMLSGLGLSTLEGISKLTGTVEGKAVPLHEVDDLQLFLNDNALETLPEEMAGFDKVTFLYLNKNHVHAIPPVVGKMKGLQGMYFTDNLIAEIPGFVFEMRQLRKLQVSKNHVKVIPPEIGQLTHLIHLNLSENDIAVLPDSMANLTLLRVCDLSDNRLMKLPEAFGAVPILYQLRVRDNPLSSLPAGFAQMPGTIDITGTGIHAEDLPPALRARISTSKPAVKPKVIKAK